MTLSRREGVDIRPTLLRVLTDLYVQAHKHTPDEERQFVELTSRLIEQVDDATRAAVRARLAIYPGTPLKTMIQLGLKPAHPGDRVPLEKIVRTRDWSNIPAVKNGRVYCIRDEYLNTPAPTLIQGLRALATAIHPECFPQADGLRCISSAP